MTTKEFAAYALADHPDKVEAGSMLGAIIDVARQNDKHPAWVKVVVGDDLVKNIKGNEKLKNAYIMLKIYREVIDRANSPLVLP